MDCAHITNFYPMHFGNAIIKSGHTVLYFVFLSLNEADPKNLHHRTEYLYQES